MIQPITNTSVSGTETIICPNGYLGAVLITTDGTNAGTVVIRKDGADGQIMYNYSGKEAGFHEFNKGMLVGKTIYYSISGTGCKAQLFEYVP